MKQRFLCKIIACILIIVIAILSFTKLSNHFSKPETYSKTIEKLDEQKENAMIMAAAATATSVAITVLPGDVGSSIADELADVNGYCVLILTAILAEKYLLTIIGYVVFKFLIPIMCILGCILLFKDLIMIKKIFVKVLVLSIALMLAIPGSVKIDELIENTHEQSVEKAIEQAEVAKEEMGKLSQITTSVKLAVNNFLEAVAIMIIVNMVMPILTLLFLIWIINLVLGTNFKLGTIKIKPQKRKTGQTDSMEALDENSLGN